MMRKYGNYQTRARGKKQFTGEYNLTTEQFLNIKMQYQLEKAKIANLVTVASNKPPEYYMKLIRTHFTLTSDEVKLQSVGRSCPNLVQVACLMSIRGYGSYKRIKNDNIIIPIGPRPGQPATNKKKVRLTVKIHRAPNFKEIVQREIDIKNNKQGCQQSEKSQLAYSTSPITNNPSDSRQQRIIENKSYNSNENNTGELTLINPSSQGTISSSSSSSTSQVQQKDNGKNNGVSLGERDQVQTIVKNIVEKFNQVPKEKMSQDSEYLKLQALLSQLQPALEWLKVQESSTKIPQESQKDCCYSSLPSQTNITRIEIEKETNTTTKIKNYNLLGLDNYDYNFDEEGVDSDSDHNDQEEEIFNESESFLWDHKSVQKENSNKNNPSENTNSNKSNDISNNTNQGSNSKDSDNRIKFDLIDLVDREERFLYSCEKQGFVRPAEDAFASEDEEDAKTYIQVSINNKSTLQMKQTEKKKEEVIVDKADEDEFEVKRVRIGFDKNNKKL